MKIIDSLKLYQSSTTFVHIKLKSIIRDVGVRCHLNCSEII